MLLEVVVVHSSSPLRHRTEPYGCSLIRLSTVLLLLLLLKPSSASLFLHLCT